MRIDIHTHAFHPKIAGKVIGQLEGHYKIRAAGTGTIEDLLARARKASLDKVVTLCAATSPEQVVPADDYALALQRDHPEVIAFGTLHPDFAEWERELARLKNAGVRGIKLHPEFQGFRLDDPCLLPIFEQARDDFIFEIHIGDRLPPAKNPSCPYKMAAILDKVPGLRVIAAHLGGLHQWEHSLAALAGRDIWLETSSSMDYITDATLRGIVRAHPRERLLFGSDYPAYDPSEEYHKLQRRCGFSDSEMDGLLANAGALFGLK